jgi:hypothetical protein
MKVAADQMLEAASGLVDDEERKDAELRGKFGSKWTRSLSSTLNAPLKKDLEKHRHQVCKKSVTSGLDCIDPKP